jgi:hypothetical protein
LNSLLHYSSRGTKIFRIFTNAHCTEEYMGDPRRTEELTVITKAYDLIPWSCNHTGKFPRNHRFVLGERIERNLYDLLEILIRAKYTKQRQELLEQANLVLEC